MVKTVYVDNAATTAMSDEAIAAMMPYLKDNFGNPSSLHTVGQRAKEALEGARAKIAKLLGADPKEIYFTSGGSEADNQALRSAAYVGLAKGKKHIITPCSIPAKSSKRRASRSPISTCIPTGLSRRRRSKG